MKSTRTFNKRMRLYEAAENGVAAIINISPNSVIDLMEGDELTVDMITDADDEPLEQLVSLADAVIVDEVLGNLIVFKNQLIFLVPIISHVMKIAKIIRIYWKM